MTTFVLFTHKKLSHAPYIGMFSLHYVIFIINIPNQNLFTLILKGKMSLLLNTSQHLNWEQCSGFEELVF